VMTLDGEMRGQKLKLTTKGASLGCAAKLEHYVNTGVAVPIRAYNKIGMRQSSIFQLLVMVVDEIRSEILDRKPHLTAIQARPKLMQCAGCMLISYCSKPCQVNDRSSHRGFCQAHRA